MIEAPAALHATDRVDGAGEGHESRKDEERSGVAVGKVRQIDGDGKADEDEKVTA